MRFRSSTHIRSENVRKMLQFTHDLQQVQSIDDFSHALMKLTEEILPHAHIVVEETNVANGKFRFFHNYNLSRTQETSLTEIIYTLYRQKPINQYLSQGGCEKVIRNTEILSYSHLAKTDFHHHVLKPLEASRQLYIIPDIKGIDLKLSVCRENGELSDEVAEMFRILVDHISAVHGAVRNRVCLQELSGFGLDPANESRLTPRESEILYWIHQGKRNSEVAVILKISERTVEKHMQNILRKLGVETRTSAAVRAGQLLQLTPAAQVHGAVTGISANVIRVRKPNPLR